MTAVILFLIVARYPIIPVPPPLQFLSRDRNKRLIKCLTFNFRCFFSFRNNGKKQITAMTNVNPKTLNQKFIYALSFFNICCNRCCCASSKSFSMILSADGLRLRQKMITPTTKRHSGTNHKTSVAAVSGGS